MDWASYALGAATPPALLAAIYVYALIQERPRGDWYWSFNDHVFLFRGGWRWPANSIKGWWFPLWLGRVGEGDLCLRVGTRRTCLLLKQYSGGEF